MFNHYYKYYYKQTVFDPGLTTTLCPLFRRLIKHMTKKEKEEKKKKTKKRRETDHVGKRAQVE